jgi:hypothetical protein
MKAKVKKVVDQIVEILKEWNGVEAVVLQHFAEKDIYDPNFSVTLDVFRKGEIPDKDKRQVHFKDADFFESSSTSVKDRFMLGDLPVRISYKDTVRVDAVLNAIEGNSWMSMERGTYLFHRIATGTVVWTRGDWIKAVLSKLDSLPEDFWSTWIDSCNHRIDHFLGDIGASSIKEDELYFRLSLSGFLKAVAECLFAVNQVFEPGPGTTVPPSGCWRICRTDSRRIGGVCFVRMENCPWIESVKSPRFSPEASSPCSPERHLGSGVYTP